MKNIEYSNINTQSAMFSNDTLHKNVAMRANNNQTSAPQIQLPAIYYNPNADYKKKSFLDVVKTFDITGFTASFFEHPLGTLGTWFALSFGMDKFNEACRGDYEKSLIAKAANAGDRISNSKLFKSETFKKTTSKITAGWNKLIAKGKEKSGVVRAFIDTPAKPEWQSAKSIMFNEQAELVQDFERILDTLGIHALDKENPTILSDVCMDFKNLDIRKGEIQEVEKFFGTSLKDIKNEEVINYINLKHIGTDEKTIRKILASPTATVETKLEIIKKMDIQFEDIAKWQKEPDKYFEEAKKAAEKVRGLSVQKGNSRFTGKLFNRKLGIDSVHNKMRSITKDGGKTALGRFNAKAIQRIYRGVTFGNGKLGALFWVSPMLMRALKNTKEADRDEKVGTAVWGVIESFLWIITLGLSTKLLYRTAGIRNAGMKKETVKEIENIKNAFNKTFLEGKFTTKKAAIEARKQAKARIKTLRNVQEQNLLTKIARSVVTPLSKDLNMMKGVTVLQKVGCFAQNCVSVPIKFFLVCYVIDSKISGAIKKGCNAIFGKDYDSYKTEEHDETKKVQKEFTKKDLTQRLYKLQAAKMAEKNKPIADKTENEELKNVIAPLPLKLDPNDELTQKKTQSQIAQNKVEEQNISQSPILQEQVEGEKNIKPDFDKQVINTEPNSNKTQIEEMEVPLKEDFEEKSITDQNKTNEQTNKFATEDKSLSEIQSKQQENSNQYNVERDDITKPFAKIKPETPNEEDSIISLTKDTPTYIPAAVSTVKMNEKLDNYTYIPSQNNVLNNSSENLSKIKKYIPSQTTANLTKKFDNSGLSQALKRADKAEQMAINILSGKF